MLVSPSKVKPSVPEQRKRASCQDGLGTVKSDLRKVNIYIWGKKSSLQEVIILTT